MLMEKLGFFIVHFFRNIMGAVGSRYNVDTSMLILDLALVKR